MSTFRERLAALRAKRTAEPIATKTPDIFDRPTQSTPTKGTPKRNAHSPQDWRRKARMLAKKRQRDGLIESGVYAMISRELPPEKEEVFVRTVEEDDGEEEEEEGEEGEVVDEEEALERAVEEEEEDQEGVGEEEGGDNQPDRSSGGEIDLLAAVCDEQSRQPEGIETKDADSHSLADEKSSDGTKEAPISEKEVIETIDHSNSADKTITTSDVIDSKKSDNSLQPEDVQQAGAEPEASEESTETTVVEEPSSMDEKQPVTAELITEQTRKPPITEVQSAHLYSPSPVIILESSRSHLAMIEDEAIDGEQKSDAQQRSDDEELGVVEGIVADADVTPQKTGENARLANFHRRWELKKEQTDANTAAHKGVEDMGEAMDLTEALKMEEEALSKDVGIVAESAEVEAAEVEGEQDGNRATTENYIDQMFLRDDSKSRMVEEDVEQTEEEQQKSRALWKTRQKIKMQRDMEDENSLSKLDMFKDCDEHRSTEIRLRLETSCRPPVREEKKPKKRSFAWASEEPEWTKRRRIMLEQQRKRAKAVSMSSWSFQRYGEQKKPPTKPPRKGSRAKPSVTPSYTVRRKRTVVTEKVEIKARVNKKPNTHSSSRGPTSFRGLLSILGKQATAEKTS